MADQPHHCPLCGGERTRCFQVRVHGQPRIVDEWCDTIECKLPKHLWPRIAEFVAIRDAAVAWATTRDVYESVDLGVRLMDLVKPRQEAENERPRSAPEASAE